jgi:hypothetical protein
MSSSQRHRWREYFYGREPGPEPTPQRVEEAWQKRRIWEGLHLVVSTEYGIVTAATMADNTNQNIEVTKRLLDLTRNVAMCEFEDVHGDGAYTTNESYILVESYCSRLWSPFKEDSHRGGNSPAWARGWDRMHEEPYIFKREFHARSVVEAVIGGIKARCGERLIVGRLKNRKEYAAMTPEERAEDDVRRQHVRHCEALAKVAGFQTYAVVAKMLANGIDHPAFVKDLPAWPTQARPSPARAQPSYSMPPSPVPIPATATISYTIAWPA